jgi:predicted transcriptional regulator of viral defense system
VLDAVERGLDTSAIELEPRRVRVILGVLEARGFVRRSGIGSYERAAGVHPLST